MNSSNQSFNYSNELLKKIIKKCIINVSLINDTLMMLL